MVRAMRMLNAVEAGTLSGAQFEDMLTDPGRLSEWNVLLGMRGQARRIVTSLTTMTAILESPLATTCLFTNPVSNAAAESSASLLSTAIKSADLTAVIASSTAMKLVAASSSAMPAAIASTAIKMAFFNSDVALNAIAASPTAMAACRAAAQYEVRALSLNASETTVALPGTSYIVLGCSTSAAASRRYQFSTLRSDSTISTVAPFTRTLASTTATDFDIAIPIVTPYKIKPVNTGPVTLYYGILRCDI